jgi:peptidoglycan/LPS O-acetylase OafA/YrhL
MSDLSLNKSKRIFYIDNIRLFLTILVILHHVAIVYGGSGYFPVLDTPTNIFIEVSPSLW